MKAIRGHEASIAKYKEILVTKKEDGLNLESTRKSKFHERNRGAVSHTATEQGPVYKENNPISRKTTTKITGISKS